MTDYSWCDEIFDVETCDDSWENYYKLCPASCNNCHQLRCFDDYSDCSAKSCVKDSEKCAETCGLCGNRFPNEDEAWEAKEFANFFREDLGIKQNLLYN